MLKNNFISDCILEPNIDFELVDEYLKKGHLCKLKEKLSLRIGFQKIN